MVIAVPAGALLALVCGAVFIALAFGGTASCGGASAAASSGEVKGAPARLVPIYQQASARYRLGPLCL